MNADQTILCLKALIAANEARKELLEGKSIIHKEEDALSHALHELRISEEIPQDIKTKSDADLLHWAEKQALSLL